MTEKERMLLDAMNQHLQTIVNELDCTCGVLVLVKAHEFDIRQQVMLSIGTNNLPVHEIIELLQMYINHYSQGATKPQGMTLH